MSTTIRPTGSDDTHRIWGEVPGWAHCDAWIPSGDPAPDGEPITCVPCAAMAAKEDATV